MQNNKILFVIMPEKGHINPMIGIAQYLQAAGFELAFFTQEDTSEQLLKAGVHARIFADPSKEHIDKEFITRGKLFVEQLADKIWMHDWIKTLLIDSVPSQVERIHTAVKAFQPALIISDPMIYATPIVAHLTNIPWVGVSSSLNPVTPSSWRCELTKTLKALKNQSKSLFKSYGLTCDFKVSDAISPWLNIVFSTEAYTPRALSNNNFSFYVGHCFPLHNRGDETNFPFDKLRPDCKKVYMSMGSQIYYHPQLFNAIAAALYDDNIQLIFSINELMKTNFATELPDNVIAVDYAPQLQLLEHMDLTISHGGANSVMESLTHGVPVAIFPICNDQFFQAKFVMRAATGVALDPKRPSPKAYRKKLLPLLDPESPEKSNAKIIGHSFTQYGGAREAASLIEQLHKTKKPMLPT